jgi:queuine/archaeosine tRNA-ribosyltransferase
LYFIIHLVETMRVAIESEKFGEFKESFLKRYQQKTLMNTDETLIGADN